MTETVRSVIEDMAEKLSEAVRLDYELRLNEVLKENKGLKGQLEEALSEIQDLKRELQESKDSLEQMKTAWMMGQSQGTSSMAEEVTTLKENAVVQVKTEDLSEDEDGLSDDPNTIEVAGDATTLVNEGIQASQVPATSACLPSSNSATAAGNVRSDARNGMGRGEDRKQESNSRPVKPAMPRLLKRKSIKINDHPPQSSQSTQKPDDFRTFPRLTNGNPSTTTTTSESIQDRESQRRAELKIDRPMSEKVPAATTEPGSQPVNVDASTSKQPRYSTGGTLPSPTMYRITACPNPSYDDNNYHPQGKGAEVRFLHSQDKVREEANQRDHFCTCGTSFISEATLMQHLRYFNEEWKFQCPVCKIRFFSTQVLRSHLLSVHRKYLPLGVAGCSNCGRIFPSRRDVLHHRRNSGCSGLKA